MLPHRIGSARPAMKWLDKMVHAKTRWPHRGLGLGLKMKMKETACRAGREAVMTAAHARCSPTMQPGHWPRVLSRSGCRRACRSLRTCPARRSRPVSALLARSRWWAGRGGVQAWAGSIAISRLLFTVARMQGRCGEGARACKADVAGMEGQPCYIGESMPGERGRYERSSIATQA